MSEKIPERIEREMYEIRSKMEPDVVDLKKHVEPQVVAERVKKTVRERVQDAIQRIRANLAARGRELLESGRGQLQLAKKAGQERDPGPFTDAVKSDPKPMAILAVLLAVMLLTLRRVTRD
jgi:hypothetical protein